MVFVWRCVRKWGLVPGRGVLIRDRNAQLSYFREAERDMIAEYLVQVAQGNAA